MQLAGPGVFGPPADPAAARAVLRRAVELGVDHIDTAQYYGPDVVNELIRDALHPYPAGLRLVSKVGAAPDRRGGVLPASQPDELRAGVEANLRTLASRGARARQPAPDGPRPTSRSPSSSARSRRSRTRARSSRSGSATRASTRSRPRSSSSTSARSRTPTTSGSGTTRTSCASAPIATSPTSRSSRSGRRGAGGGAPTTRRSPPSPRSTARRPPRSPWPGCCTRIRTSCSSRAPRRSPTWSRTWPPPASSSTTTTSPISRSSVNRG